MSSPRSVAVMNFSVPRGEPQHLREHPGRDLGVVVERDGGARGRADRDAQEPRLRELHAQTVDALVERGLRRRVVHHARVGGADAVGAEVGDDPALGEPAPRPR